MAAKTFNLSEVTISVNGVPVTGFADGDAVSIEPDGELWSKQVGSDGEVLRSRQNQPGGQITFNLQHGSALNSVFDAIYKADLAVGIGTQVAIVIADLFSAYVAVSSGAWLMSIPSKSMGREPGAVEWVWDCADLDVTHGTSLPL